MFIGSLTSARGIANIAPYAAAKSALLGVIRTLAVEWAAWVHDRIPLGRLGDPAT